MKRNKIRLAFAFFLALSSIASGQGYQFLVYKTVDALPVRMMARYPNEAKEGCPSIVFFHGGNWNAGSALQFLDFFEHFNKSGYAAFSVDYRLIGSTAKTIGDEIDDAVDAIHWVASNAERLKIDAGRIYLCGYSAGAHLALSAVMLPPPDRLLRKPRGLVLIAAPVDPEIDPAFMEYIRPATSADAYSPFHSIDSHLPPMLFFQGTKDEEVSYPKVVSFVKMMKEKGNYCRLVVFKGKGHHLFNSSNDLNTIFTEMESFFRYLGGESKKE
jgi:acetyl esterase/lipase